MDVDKLKREQELEGKAPDRRESAMVSRHTTHRKVHEPPTGVSRALEVTPFKFLLKRMVKQDVLAGRKPLGESERAWLCKSAESCSLRACGSSSVCEREKALENSSNILVGMSACVGSDSLVGMSACVGSNSLVGMSAACVGSDSLVGMSAACVGQSGLVGMSSSRECGGTDSSVGMSLSVRDQSFCDFGAGENKAPSSQRALNAQETCCTAGFIKAVGAMMRMLLIWLLAFSTFVGVGCEEIGPSPTASLLDKYYLAPPSSLLDSEYLAFSFRWHGFQPRCVAKRILFRSWGYAVMLGDTSRRDIEGCRASITILAPGASRSWWFCGFLSSFYNEPGWMETQLNLPCVEGLQPEDVEVIPAPPISCTEYTPPLGAQENPQRVYVQDAETLTVDLIEAHSKRFSMASEGESWSLMGWSQDRFRALLADQTFDMSIDTINLAHVGLRAVGAYESLAYGEAKAFRAAHPTPIDVPDFASVGRLGIGRFNHGMDAMKGWLRRNCPPHEMVSAMTPATETPPPMISEIRSRAMDVSLPVLARRRAEAKIEANTERERSRGRSGPVEYVAPKMLASSEAYSVEANACCPGGIGCSTVPDAAVISKVAIEKVSPALPPRGFVMVVRPP